MPDYGIYMSGSISTEAYLDHCQDHCWFYSPVPNNEVLCYHVQEMYHCITRWFSSSTFMFCIRTCIYILSLHNISAFWGCAIT